MPSYLDLALLGVVTVSALLSMVRGFTREILAIASWAAAAVSAYYLYPAVLPYVKPYIAKDTVATVVAVATVFFVTLIVVSIITVRLSEAILDSKVGALDRTLGFVFGAARGFLLGVVAFLFFSWLVPPKSQPAWVLNAKSKPLLQATGDEIVAMLPEDPESTFLKGLKREKTPPGDDIPAEGDASAPKPPPAANDKKSDASVPGPKPPGAPADRTKLDALFGKVNGGTAPKSGDKKP